MNEHSELTPQQFEELLRKEMEAVAPPPAPRRERIIPPEVQAELDRILDSVRIYVG